MTLLVSSETKIADRSATEVTSCKSACLLSVLRASVCCKRVKLVNLSSLSLDEPSQITFLGEGAGV